MRVSRLADMTEEKEVSYQLPNVKEFTKDYSGVQLFSDKVKNTLAMEEITKFSQIYPFTCCANINGVIYAVNTAQVLYKYTDDTITKITSLPSTISEFARVLYQGVDTLLVMCDNGYSIACDRGSTAMAMVSVSLYTKTNAVLGDMLFLLRSNRLSFKKFEDIDNMCNKFSSSGDFIDFPKCVGEPIALVPYNKHLLIFFQKAIYELKPFGESIEYQLSKKYTLSEDIIDGSVCKVGNGVCYLAGGKLYRYIDEKIESFDLVKDIKSLTFEGKAWGVNNKFAMLSSSDDQKRIFYFDLETLAEGDFAVEDGMLLCDGYYLTKNGVLQKINEDLSSTEEGEWISKPIDFNLPENKSVKGVGVSTEGEIEVDVCNAYAKKSLTFSKQSEYKRTNISSRYFIIRVSGENGLCFDNLRLKYTVRGE